MHKPLLPAIALTFFSLTALSQPAGWNDPFPPHRVMDNLYYVGTQELAAFLRQRHAAADAVKQRDTGLLLQTGNGGGDGGLGAVNGGGGAGDMLALGNGNKGAQLLQSHCIDLKRTA